MTDEQMAELKAYIAQEVEAAVTKAIEAAKADRAKRVEPTVKDMEALKKMFAEAVREKQSRGWHVYPLVETAKLVGRPLEFWQHTNCTTATLPKSDEPVVVTG